MKLYFYYMFLLSLSSYTQAMHNIFACTLSNRKQNITAITDTKSSQIISSPEKENILENCNYIINSTNTTIDITDPFTDAKISSHRIEDINLKKNIINKNSNIIFKKASQEDREFGKKILAQLKNIAYSGSSVMPIGFLICALFAANSGRAVLRHHHNFDEPDSPDLNSDSDSASDSDLDQERNISENA